MSIEFVRFIDGRCALTDDDGNTLWSSDNDEEFLEEFDAAIDPDEIDDVLDYLEDAGYLDDADAVDIVDEGETGDATGAHKIEDAPWLH